MQRMLFNVRRYVLLHAYIKHRIARTRVSLIFEFRAMLHRIKITIVAPDILCALVIALSDNCGRRTPAVAREPGARQVCESTNLPIPARLFILPWVFIVVERKKERGEKKNEKRKRKKEREKNPVVGAQCRINRTRGRSRSPCIIPGRGIFIVAGGGEREGETLGEKFLREHRAGGEEASRYIILRGRFASETRPPPFIIACRFAVIFPY